MGTLTGQQLLDRAAKTLYDETNVEYSAAELLNYLAEGINAVVAVKFDAYTVQERIQLQEGTVQELPAHGTYLVRLLRNAGADGVTPGRGISWVDLEELNRADPDWHTAAQSNTVDQYAYDSRDRRYFYVSPPQDFPGHWVEAIFHAVPARFDDVTATIPIDDTFADALHGYVVGECLLRGTGRESEKPNPERAAHHKGAFAAMLKAISEAQAATEVLRRT